MITLLSRLFIRNHKDYADAQVRCAYGVLCGSVGIVLNIGLFALKFFAGILCGSVAVTADAFNNLSDAASSAVTLIGFKLSEKKPDFSHPFGHGRIEYVAGLIVSFLILLMGFQLGDDSIQKLFVPNQVQFSYLTAIILLVSIFVKLYMSFYNRSIGKKIQSAAMGATAADSISDTVSTTVVLVTMLFSRHTDFPIDAVCGLLVSVFILITGIRSTRDTVSPLLGQRPEPETVEEIRRIVLSFPEAIGLHDLVIHDYGCCRRMVTLHVEVDAKGDILAMHDAIDIMERTLAQKLSCEATIHMDPIVQDDPELKAIRRHVEEYVKAQGQNLQIHDFRMVKGQTHTNVIFDIVIPFSEKEPDRIVENLKRLVNEYNSHYFAVINADTQYS